MFILREKTPQVKEGSLWTGSLFGEKIEFPARPKACSQARRGKKFSAKEYKISLFFFFARKFLWVGTLYYLWSGSWKYEQRNSNWRYILLHYLSIFFLCLLAQDSLFTSLRWFMFIFSGYTVVMGLCLSVFISALEYEYSCSAIWIKYL